VLAAALPAATGVATAAAVEPPPAPPEPAGAFPPPDYQPPHPRTAQADDGRWSPRPEGDRGGRHALYASTVHTDPVKGWPFVMVLAFDRREVELVPCLPPISRASWRSSTAASRASTGATG
jgi:hypothetical protein